MIGDKSKCENCRILGEIIEKQLHLLRVQTMTLKELKEEQEKRREMWGKL